MKPIIGITPSYGYNDNKFHISENYVKAIKQAGGIPILLFPSEEFPKFIDGIVLSGGGDIDPLLFGEEPLRNNGEISPLRDAFELQLAQTALERDVPILGVCRGMQIFAILSRGKIIQDIYSQTNSTLKHMQQAPRFYGTHTVFVKKDSQLHKICKKEHLVVNSFHHQAIASAGNDFVVSAKSADDIIEAIEHTKNAFAIGVQWHPEAMADVEQKMLFQSFIDKAKQMKNK